VTALTASAFGGMQACTLASAAYTVTLPTPAGYAGQQIGVRVTPGSTFLLTVATAAGNIDGKSTRIMWAGESAILESDGTNWCKIGGKTLPMVGAMTLLANFSVPNSAVTVVPLTATYLDNTGLMCNTTNGYPTVQRPGNYEVKARLSFISMPAISNRTICTAYKNGASRTCAAQDERYAAASGSPCIGASGVEIFASGDYCNLNAYQTSGSAVNTQPGSAGHGDGTFLSLTEILAW